MKRTLMIILPLLISLVPIWAWGGTYYVTASGGGTTWANCTSRGAPCTLATANSSAIAGDIVIMINDSGNFTTQINPSNNGSSGSYITFQGETGTTVTIDHASTCVSLGGKSYIKVVNLTLQATSGGYWWVNMTSSGSGVTHHIILEDIIGVRMSAWGTQPWSGFFILNAAHDITLRNVTLDGGEGAEKGHADTLYFLITELNDVIERVLIEDSTIHGGSHNTFAFQNSSKGPFRYITIRNNTISNPNHSVVNIWGTGQAKLHHFFLENNIVKDSGSICSAGSCNENIYGSSRDRGQSREGHAGVQIAGGSHIFRFNEVFNNGRVFHSDNYDLIDNKYYNNTFYNNGQVVYWNSGNPTFYGNSFINNIMSLNNLPIGGTNHPFNINSIPVGSNCDHTIAYNDVYDTAENAWRTCEENIRSNTIAYLDANTDDFSNNITTDPLMTDPANNDFTLQSGSPAIDAGGALTTVSSGCGTSSLVLADAKFFQDGTWEPDDSDVVDADWVAIGTVNNVQQISSISSNTLTFASTVNCTNGANVWLYKDSDGTVVLHGSAPEMGAHEYTSGLLAPKGLKIIIP